MIKNGGYAPNAFSATLYWNNTIMPKAIDLRLHGISFENAMKRFIAAPPMPSSKSAKKATASKPKRAKK